MTQTTITRRAALAVGLAAAIGPTVSRAPVAAVKEMRPSW